jgi:hypothetical protein
MRQAPGCEIVRDGRDFRQDGLKKIERTALYEVSLNHLADLRNRFVKRLILFFSKRAQATLKTRGLPPPGAA